MINNLLKNFCLITFALIAPITLPAGGIQKSLNQIKYLDYYKETYFDLSFFEFHQRVMLLGQLVQK